MAKCRINGTVCENKRLTQNGDCRRTSQHNSPYKECLYEELSILSKSLTATQAQLEERTRDEIHALIEKYGDPQYKTSEFALYDVISVAQQLQAQLTAAEAKQCTLRDYCPYANFLGGE